MSKECGIQPRYTVEFHREVNWCDAVSPTVPYFRKHSWPCRASWSTNAPLHLIYLCRHTQERLEQKIELKFTLAALRRSFLSSATAKNALPQGDLSSFLTRLPSLGMRVMLELVLTLQHPAMAARVRKRRVKVASRGALLTTMCSLPCLFWGT